MSVVMKNFDWILGPWVECSSVAAQPGTCVQMGLIEMLVPLFSHAAGPHHEPIMLPSKSYLRADDAICLPQVNSA